MNLRFLAGLVLAVATLGAPGLAAQDLPPCRRVPPKQRNVILFVADGLRRGSVDSFHAPAFYHVRKDGVDFKESHALFPTFTTANASAFATGHKLKDTGDFSNTIMTNKPISDSALPPHSSITPFLEDDRTLVELYSPDSPGGYMQPRTLLAIARDNGYNTAAIGKKGPTLIEDISELPPSNDKCQAPPTLIVDDSTGHPGGRPLSNEFIAALNAAGIFPVTPDRSNGMHHTPSDNGYSGTYNIPGTRYANTTQETYFTNVTTRLLLKLFQGDFHKYNKPFFLVFWSRDPDGTQHYQGDSLNRLSPGINGPTSKSAVENADWALQQILDSLELYDLLGNTDVIVVADHGFSTISKSFVTSDSRVLTQSYSTGFKYRDAKGIQDVEKGHLPPGFLAIDIAKELEQELRDPDTVGEDGQYKVIYDPHCVPNPTNGKLCNLHSGSDDNLQHHPANGNGLITWNGKMGDDTSADLVVAANGGSDLIYIPKHDHQLVKKVCEFLAKQDYVDGLFVSDDYIKSDQILVALSLSTIDVSGGTVDGKRLPVPDIVVNFKSFSLDRKNPFQTRIEIADSTLQEGQGMHGSFSRADTWNNMAAIGPDFRHCYIDKKPVSNADLAVTIAHLLGFDLKPEAGVGRTIEESLAHRRRDKTQIYYELKVSKPSPLGRKMVLVYQSFGDQKYYDKACFSNNARLESQRLRHPIKPDPCP
jgi:hypothetical protein